MHFFFWRTLGPTRVIAWGWGRKWVANGSHVRLSIFRCAFVKWRVWLTEQRPEASRDWTRFHHKSLSFYLLAVDCLAWHIGPQTPLFFKPITVEGEVKIAWKQTILKQTKTLPQNYGFGWKQRLWSFLGRFYVGFLIRLCCLLELFPLFFACPSSLFRSSSAGTGSFSTETNLL